MKIGVVGYGGMGAYHCDQIARGNKQGQTELSVKGVFDIDDSRRQVAIQNGLHVYSSLEELLSDNEIKGVIIATPNDTHLPICTAVAKSKKHILCEKPIARSYKEALEMYSIAQGNGVTLCVNQNRRFDEDYLKVRKMAEENCLGELYRIESTVSGSNGIPGRWRREKERGGGMMFDWGVHLIDQMYTLFGMPEKICCSLDFLFKCEVDDGFTFVAKYKNGLEYVIRVETNCFIHRSRWKVFGFEGSAEISDWKNNGEMVRVKERHDKMLCGIHAGNGLTKTMANRRLETVEKLALPIVERNDYAIYNNFVQVINGGECITRKKQILSVMKLMESAFESSEKDGNYIYVKE